MRCPALDCLALAALVLAACETGPTHQQSEGSHRGTFTHCATCATDAGSTDSDVLRSDAGADADGSTPSCVPSCTGKSCGSDGCNGTCGSPCAQDQVCTQGQCVKGTCPAGTIDCHSSCIDYLIDVNNCGACDNRCPTHATATAQCIVGACYLHCPGQENQRVSVDLQNDPDNCGACGNVCPPPIQGARTCTSGSCAGPCPSGKTNCGGQCVDLTSDIHHCGSCPNACPVAAGGMTTCTSSHCTGPCFTTTDIVCSVQGTPTCVDPRFDANNCGGCGRVCSAPVGGSPYCSLSQCVGSCPSGQGVCNNQCINISTDTNNCGGCGVTCTSFASQHGLVNTANDTFLACMWGRCTGKFSSTQSETCGTLCTGVGLSCVAPPSSLVSTWWNRCPSPQHNLGGAYWITQATGGGCTNYSDQAHIASIAFDQECTDFAPSPSYQWTFNGQPQPMYFDTMWCSCQ